MESQEMLLVCNNRPSFSPLLSSSLCLIWIFEICPHTPEHENDKMKSIKKSLTRIRFYSCYTFFKRWIWRPFIWIQRDIHCSRTKFDQTINFIILQAGNISSFWVISFYSTNMTKGDKMSSFDQRHYQILVLNGVKYTCGQIDKNPNSKKTFSRLSISFFHSKVKSKDIQVETTKPQKTQIFHQSVIITLSLRSLSLF